jgi:hypothetical protein
MWGEARLQFGFLLNLKVRIYFMLFHDAVSRGEVVRRTVKLPLRGD